MRIQPLRWYAHGDQMEGVPVLFYCRHCQIYTTRDHFDKPVREVCGQRGGDYPAPPPALALRPDDAVNVFDLAPAIKVARYVHSVTRSRTAKPAPKAADED